MSDSVSSQLSATATILLFFAWLSLIVVAGALLWVSRPEPTAITIHPPPPTDTPMPTSTPAPTATPGPLQVYVTGAVKNPQQTHILPAGSRVADAVEAAGGPTDDADLIRINLAGFLRDGTQIHLPALEEDEIVLATPIDSYKTRINSDLAEPIDGEKVRINIATQSELESLPGIGPVTATRIINYREQAGDFGNLDDLDEVSGIGPATLENLRDLVVFD